MVVDEQWAKLELQPESAITTLATANGPDGSVITFAGSATGVYRSLDDGRTWTRMIEKGVLSLVSSVIPSPRFLADGTVFAGAANGCYRVSDDSNASQLLLGGVQVLALAVVPDTDVLREVDETIPGVLFVGTERDGVVRSGDGGRNWEAANVGLLDLSALAFAFSPRFSQDRTGFLASASGLYRTRNGGKAWRMVDVAQNDIAFQSLAISPSFDTDGRLFAGSEEHGLYCSVDCGSTWTHVKGLAASSISALSISTDGKVTVAGTEKGAAITFDGGESWHWDGGVLGAVLSACVLSLPNGNVIVAGLLANGVATTKNDGVDWVVTSAGLP